MTAPAVTLLSDFGLRDHYVAEMKAVILDICPEARVVDISHLVEKFNVRMGAFLLASASRYFAKGTIHVAVVDPGVGTKRRPLLLQTHSAFYIGPDNGLLMLAARRDRIEHAYEVTNSRLMLPTVSPTFHGRDLFAPSAAHLACGKPPTDFGDEINDYMIPEFAKPELREGELRGEVLHIDDFGNVITNITNRELEKASVKPRKQLSIKLNNKAYKTPLVDTYGDVSAKSVLALVGSHGFLEFAVNQGSASNLLRAKVGDGLTIALRSD